MIKNPLAYGFLGILSGLFLYSYFTLAETQNESYLAASEKGVEILGAIVEDRGLVKNSTVLLKDLKTSKTYTRKTGALLTDDSKYWIVEIQTDYISIQEELGSQSKIRLYKFGTMIPQAPKLKEKVQEPIRLGSYKEDGFEREESQIKLTAEYRQKILGDLSSILMQAAAEEVKDANNNTVGWGLYDLQEGSIFEKGGLKHGDVVQEINGVPLTTADQAVKLLNSLKTSGNIEFTLIRNGQTIPFTLNVQ